MSAGESRGVCRTPACLCVLCGLPAAGKSSLSRRILGASARHGWRAAAVPYDDLIPETAFRVRPVEVSVTLQEMPTEWKSHRQAVLHCIEAFLKKPEMSVELPNSSQINISVWEQCVRALQNPEDIMPNKASLLFLLDDNFYYPSMRYEVCQLARKYSIGFCQVHLQCDLESCISRNQKRPQPIPTEVILDMAKRLEAPNPQKNSWELYSISLNTTENVSEFDLQRVMELISTALNNPLSPVEDNAEQKEADRVKCASSVVHQADQACRRLISEAMKTARENRVSSDHMRILASQLNESKAAFLQNLRKQLLQDVNLIHQEDIDVEHTVKRAMDIFNDQKKQILLGIINKHP